MKEVIGKLDFTKIKNFYFVKDTFKRMRRQAIDRERIFSKDICDKGLLSKIYEELLKLNYKKTSNLIKKWGRSFKMAEE